MEKQLFSDSAWKQFDHQSACREMILVISFISIFQREQTADQIEVVWNKEMQESPNNHVQDCYIQIRNQLTWFSLGPSRRGGGFLNLYVGFLLPPDQIHGLTMLHHYISVYLWIWSGSMSWLILWIGGATTFAWKSGECLWQDWYIRISVLSSTQEILTILVKVLQDMLGMRSKVLVNSLSCIHKNVNIGVNRTKDGATILPTWS